jgi:hypothetical protein
MRYLIIGCLLFSQLAMAEIYKCVDPGTGRMTFTDKACKQKTTGEHVQVDPTNFNSGTKKHPGNRTWVSQDPTRNNKGSEGCGSTSSGHRRNVEKARGSEQTAQGEGC